MKDDGDTHYYRNKLISDILKWILACTYIIMYFSFMAIFIESSGQERFAHIFYSAFLLWVSIKILPYNTDILGD